MDFTFARIVFHLSNLWIEGKRFITLSQFLLNETSHDTRVDPFTMALNSLLVIGIALRKMTAQCEMTTEVYPKFIKFSS